jgi:hypothetical protein
VLEQFQRVFEPGRVNAAASGATRLFDALVFVEEEEFASYTNAKPKVGDLLLYRLAIVFDMVETVTRQNEGGYQQN